MRPLLELPDAITGQCELSEYHSLAVRDLERGEGVALPSGESVARHLGQEPLSRDEIGLKRAGWSGDTPLWYYVLREADVRGGGNRLGPVGGRIVGEVLVGLLDCDPTPVRFAPAEWKPRAKLRELLLGAIPRRWRGAASPATAVRVARPTASRVRSRRA